jgi:alginate O-acetyltransferase complex protein AlgJ
MTTNQWSSRAIALGFVVLLSLPVVAFIAGVRGEVDENREQTERPAITIGALLDTAQTEQFDAYATDVMPFREDLVTLDARLDRAMGDSPTSSVIVGRDGWLFLDETILQRCLDDDASVAFVDALERADRVLDVVGKRLVLVLAPDKASIYPENVRFTPTCPLETAATLQELEVPDGVEFVRVWEAMRATKQDTQLYRTLDTHWNAAGAAVAAEALIETLSPGSWDPDAVEKLADRVEVGDLTTLMGLPEPETIPVLRSSPPGSVAVATAEEFSGVDGEAIEGLAVQRYRAEPATGAIIGGSTVVLHDSFGVELVPLVGAYFEDALFVDRTAPVSEFLRRPLEDADTVVWLSTQRSFAGRLIDRDLAREFVVAYREQLTPVPATADRSGRTVTVAVSEGSGDRYVVVGLPPGVPDARFLAGESRFFLDAQTPVAALRVDGPSVSFTVEKGDVEVSAVVVD